MSDKITEQDFRMPEFVGADPNDYERRKDGEIVRKDRWEAGIIRIASAVGLNVKSFEIEDVVAEVNNLLKPTEFPYTVTFTAISEAVKWCPNKVLEISVEKFEQSYNAAIKEMLCTTTRN